jgi:hypothetical protein
MPPIDPEARFTRAKDFESRVAALEFPPEVWAVFSMLEQPSSARDIAAALLTPLPAVLQALERLRDAEIIQAKAIGWTEFAKRPKAPATTTTRASGDSTVALRIAPPTVAAPAAVSLVLGQARPVVAPPTLRVWKLRPALDAIAATAGGGVPGQLLLLKLFLQIPPDILKASGVESLSAVGPDFEFTNPELRDTLLKIARTQASVDLTPHLPA